MTFTAILNGSRRVVAGLAFVAGLTFAGTVEASTEWRGGGFVAEFDNCESGGWPSGMVETIRARYRPSGLPNNGNTSRLTLLFNNGADAYRTRQGRFANRFSEVDGMGVWSTGYVFDPDPRIRILQHQPSNISASTDRIRLVGMIRHFNGVRGCRVRFDVSLRRRP